LFQKPRISAVRCLLFSIQVSILSSCASISEQVLERPADWESRLQHQQQLSEWTIKARLGVQTETEGGSFDVFWQQMADAYEIRLLAPMGRGAVLINGDSAGVSISRADGKTEYSHDADALFASMTGLSLPVNGLQDWLRGMPIQGENIHHISWNEHGQLYRLEQRGWQVEMSRYKTIAGYELPQQFYLEREDQPELSVRLLVREWQPAP
jgi:outer membrane lipoprotein LolB